MARWYRLALVSLAVLALCTAAWAQPGPGGPPPGGRGPGMFGGFGGGFGGGSLSMMYPQLLNSPTVQKELELVEDQNTKLKELNQKSQAAMREMFSGMRDLSNEERQAKMQEMGKKMQARAEETKKAIEEILLPHQIERIKGIALQVAGVGALNFKQVQEDLKMTEDQVSKIKSINEESGKKAREMFSGMRDLGDEERRAKMQEMGKKMQEMRKETEKQLSDVLTPDQKASLDKMKGEKLEIPPGEMFGPGGPRGRRGQGGPAPQPKSE